MSCFGDLGDAAKRMGLPRAALAGAAALAVACVALVALGVSCQGSPAFVAPGDREGQSEEARTEVSGIDDAVAGGHAPDDSDSAGETEDGAVVTVHIAGAVASPGVISLAEGARVQDAVDAAGGFVDDAAIDAVNLARVVQDGEQVVIPTHEQIEAGAVVQGQIGSSAAEGAPAVVNINSASIEELDTLPGVGEATAQAIVDEREQNGPFASIEDIQRVSGIGEKKFENLKDLICV